MPNENLSHFQSVIQSLTDPEHGCPWDKEQTPLSMCEYLIEECHELVDAVRSGKTMHACDEMGDLMFVILLMAQCFEKEGKFSFSDALRMGAEKMVRRHPHVFGENANGDLNNDPSYVALKGQWKEIKAKEKAEAKEQGGVYSSLPTGLPPLTKSYRIHAKAESAGFTWESDEDVERQVEAEWLELLDARASGSKEAEEHELGDMLFSLVELGRRMGIKSAEALDLTANRFVKRFNAMENLAKEKKLDFSSLSLDEKDNLWDEVKEKTEHKENVRAVEFAVPKDTPES